MELHLHFSSRLQGVAYMYRDNFPFMSKLIDATEYISPSHEIHRFSDL
jgi:hypothetical protein